MNGDAGRFRMSDRPGSHMRHQCVYDANGRCTRRGDEVDSAMSVSRQGPRWSPSRALIWLIDGRSCADGWSTESTGTSASTVVLLDRQRYRITVEPLTDNARDQS